MAPKHSLSALKEEEQTAKRAKSSATPGSRSATPAEAGSVPFDIKYPDMKATKRSKKEQEYVDDSEYQISPFVSRYPAKDGELDQYYTVVPSVEWDSMKKYNNFIIQKEVYKNNQFVYVRGGTTPKAASVEDPKDFWVARILQVRAKDPQHVYALVAWMYWPDELPAPAKKTPDQVNSHTGRRTYHGSHELVASNYMEVLDVLSFAGKAEVGHWLEEDDNLLHKLYWRQTFCRETQELSKIREHCVCGGHFNPEVAMEICESPSCKVWLHEQCIIDGVLTKTHNKLVGSAKPDVNSTGSKTNSNPKNPKTSRKIWKGKFQATIKPPKESSEKTTIVITDLRPAGNGTWSERIPCPKCGTLLE